MICLNCGKHVDDGVRVCPFCGSAIEPAGKKAEEEDTLPITLSARNSDRERPIRSEREPEELPPAPAPRLFTPAFFLSLIAVLLGVVCLVTLLSLRGGIAELKAAQKESAGTLNSALTAMSDRIDHLDATIANVQSEAYEQVASKSIEITKDLTPLVGPVEEGKYNIMFIVKAKGNLSVDTSFIWQRFNETTAGWVNVVFTGDATTNEQYGLRLENQFDAAAGEYTTILWANGITQEAAGTYRCLITDLGGISKTSNEAPVSITEPAG